MNPPVSRRVFVSATAAGAMSLSGRGAAAGERPAALGGTPVRKGGYASWPRVGQADEKGLIEVLRSAHWTRGQAVEQFEETYAGLQGAKHCVATASGTTALFTSLGALGIGPGDEVLVPPYTFMATVSAVLLHHALPVFVDSDRTTFLMNPKKIEAAITDRTRAILPVHIGGAPADLDSILAVAAKRKLPVLEDACQAHFGQWRGRGVGSWGAAGCFSFQLSKNLCSGEGGAILTNDTEIADRCFAFHNCCRRRKGAAANFNYQGRNGNFRLTEFQGALLLSQLPGWDSRAATRADNGAYLSKLLADIPGIVPAVRYEGASRNAYHLYMFRYQPEAFAGLCRRRFIRAMAAEGIPCSPGYGPLNKEPFLLNTLQSTHYRRVYGDKAIETWRERNACPENDALCEEAVWLMQNMLLGPRSDMDQIADAVRKIRAHAGELLRG